MKPLHFLTATLLAVATGTPTVSRAQQMFDITPYYLQNAGFDTDYNYDAVTAGDDAQDVIHDVSGWRHSNTNDLWAFAGTLQWGSAQTFFGHTIPAAGYDGTAQGGCMVMCSALKRSYTYYQTAVLPAGHYQLVVAAYNCNPDADNAVSLTGWVPDEGEKTLSALTAFPAGRWTTDTVSFTVDARQKGLLQVGVKSAGTQTAASAMPAIDWVKLLRDQPYSDELDSWGDLPVVTTDPRYARGATMAFGRLSATIADGTITERGFCWSEQPEPTVSDNTTTETLYNNGPIYLLRDLKPATKYFMRAYAKTEGRRVAYGATIKFCTLPKGNLTYWYNNGGDAAANNRVNAAAAQACDIFSNLTSIVKHFNIGYSAGTPTADCYYADEPWMNMGANASYQRTGTIMHEMQHGLGLVPYTTQWNKNILRSALDGEGRGTGQWLGDRVSAFLDFWDNTTGSHLNGDYQHMWPYGINGASEDNGTLQLYYANALIGQALGEDGLEHRSNTFAQPCYVFPQEDTTKYYLKCEAEDRGLYDAFLLPTANGTLRWQPMSGADALANDSTAWYVTFTPSNQYYQLRNAATGQYLTFQGGFRTMARNTVTANDNFHLMRGRVDVGTGTGALRGYWLIHPTGNLSPNCMQANAGGTVGSAAFDLRNTATRQRWLIMDAGQMTVQEQMAIAGIRRQFTDVLSYIRPLADVPHLETRANTDADFATALADLEQLASQATTVTDLMPLADEARQAAFNFLSHVQATDEEQPFDLSFMIADRGMDDTDAWTATPTLSYSCAEFYEKTFDFYQTLERLPAGAYHLRLQGFQRPGTYNDAYNDYAAGNNTVNAYLYAGTKSTRLAHIATEARTTKLGGKEASVGTGLYLPDDMQAASIYFARGLYENRLDFNIDEPATLRIGLRSTSMPTRYWCIFDNFRLHFFGSPADVQAISIANADRQADRQQTYDLQGRPVHGPTAPGLYIVNGRKVVVK